MARTFRREIIADIYVPPGRAVDAARAEELSKSMGNKSIGLLHPIVIRYVSDQEVTMPDGEIVEAAPHLVYGRHRLAAAQLLGWDEIDCEVIEADSRRARMLEIVENLHRAELSALERSEQTAEWLRLVEEEEAESLLAQVAPKLGRPQGGLRAAARDLGIDRDQARRASKIDGMDAEAKAEARVLHLDNNQSALLKAARQPSKEEQLRALREHAARRVQSPARDPLNDLETVERQADAIMAAWNRAGPEARERFLEMIDRPLADNTAALRAYQ